MRLNSLTKAAVAAAFLFACGGSPNHGDNPANINMDTAVIKKEQAVFFENINNGDMLSNPILIKFGIKEMIIMPTDSGVRANAGHHHLLIDTVPFIKAGDMLPMNSNKIIHYGKGQTYTHIELDSGKHRIALQFADGSHRSYGIRMSKVIDVFVR